MYLICSIAKAEAALQTEQGQQAVAKREYELLGKKLSDQDRDLVLRGPQWRTAQAECEIARAAKRAADAAKQAAVAGKAAAEAIRLSAAAAVEAAEAEAHAVVVTGAGKAFCAGADLSALGAAAREGLERIYAGFMAVGRCALPTIAAVNGAAVGAGLNLALAADVRIAGPHALFDPRFQKLGIHPGGGATWMLQRAVGRRAGLLVFRGGNGTFH